MLKSYKSVNNKNEIHNDPNVSSIANVDLGLSNYGYLRLYRKMAKLLKQKKYFDSKMANTEEDKVSERR